VVAPFWLGFIVFCSPSNAYEEQSCPCMIFSVGFYPRQPSFNIVISLKTSAPVSTLSAAVK
jgi:hypothetical protein